MLRSTCVSLSGAFFSDLQSWEVCPPREPHFSLIYFYLQNKTNSKILNLLMSWANEYRMMFLKGKKTRCDLICHYTYKQHGIC